MKYIFVVLYILYLLPSSFSSEENKGLSESFLDYKVNASELRKGNFQFYYALLKLGSANSFEFQSLDGQSSKTSVTKVLDKFMPLDLNNEWKPQEKNYLAVAKFTFLIPASIDYITEAKVISEEYLQRTLPNYSVSVLNRYFHIGGSLFTPSFDLQIESWKMGEGKDNLLSFLDREKLKAGKLKVFFMRQFNFGRVMFFRTAKMSCALVLYESFGKNQVLVTQFIFSNIITVPSRRLIREGMIENLTNVVKGSRSAF